MIVTGFFGIPGVHSQTKVHVAVDGKPLCGARLRKAMEFQWCAHGYNRDLVSCGSCHRIMGEHWKRDAAKKSSR